VGAGFGLQVLGLRARLVPGARGSLVRTGQVSMLCGQALVLDIQSI